jgi:hypothetical protein
LSKGRVITSWAFLFLSACGDTGPQGPAGPAGLSGEDKLPDIKIEVQRFTSDSSICVSGSGVLIEVLTDGTLNSSAVVCDGTNGLDGEKAVPSVYEITEIVDPCGDAPDIYDEIFLKTSNGTLIASFSDAANGNNTRFSILTPGNYVTTDGSNCHLTVNNDGTVSW